MMRASHIGFDRSSSVEWFRRRNGTIRGCVPAWAERCGARGSPGRRCRRRSTPPSRKQAERLRRPASEDLTDLEVLAGECGDHLVGEFAGGQPLPRMNSCKPPTCMGCSRVSEIRNIDEVTGMYCKESPPARRRCCGNSIYSRVVAGGRVRTLAPRGPKSGRGSLRCAVGRPADQPVQPGAARISWSGSSCRRVDDRGVSTWCTSGPRAIASSRRRYRHRPPWCSVRSPRR